MEFNTPREAKQFLSNNRFTELNYKLCENEFLHINKFGKIMSLKTYSNQTAKIYILDYSFKINELNLAIEKYFVNLQIKMPNQK